MVEATGSVLTKATLYSCIFSFHIVKPVIPMLSLLAIVCVSEKLE